jgi:hypothetical protein
VLGRLAAASDSVALFRRSADLAERHGLTTWRLRALQELALTEATPDGDHVRELRRVAANAGAHLTIAQMDLVLADMALNAFDRDTCREAAERCADASSATGSRASRWRCCGPPGGTHSTGAGRRWRPCWPPAMPDRSSWS